MTQEQISREDILAVLPTVSATIADALGIGIAAANHPEGGGAFTLTIPDKLVVAMAD